MRRTIIKCRPAPIKSSHFRRRIAEDIFDNALQSPGCGNSELGGMFCESMTIRNVGGDPSACGGEFGKHRLHIILARPKVITAGNSGIVRIQRFNLTLN